MIAAVWFLVFLPIYYALEIGICINNLAEECLWFNETPVQNEIKRQTGKGYAYVQWVVSASGVGFRSSFVI